MTSKLAGVVAAVVGLAVGAQVSVPVPGSPVPQSLQTLAVVLVGGWLGAGWGATAVLAYVVVGAVGLPVFADGAGGVEHLFGPTGGYLLGFVAGAAGMLILACGWARLAAMVGPAAAWTEGVGPFVLGAVAKSVVAAAVLALLGRRARAGGREGDALTGGPADG